MHNKVVVRLKFLLFEIIHLKYKINDLISILTSAIKQPV